MLLERVEQLPQHSAAAHRAHGELLVNAGDFKGALKHLEKSYMLEPSEILENYLVAIRKLVGVR